MATRAEHRRSTLYRISAATTETYEALGSETTVEDIAERAGLSRRTLFRYIDTKDDLLFLQPVLWLELFDEAISEIEDHLPSARIRHGARVVSEHIDSNPEPVRRAMAVADLTGSGYRGNAGANRQWIDRLAAELRGDHDDPEANMRAKVLGAAIMGVIDAALEEWFEADSSAPLTETIERGLDYLEPLFE